MFDSIVSHVDKCAGGIAQTEFFYTADGVSQMGFFLCRRRGVVRPGFHRYRRSLAQAARARASEKAGLNSDPR